ncbi:sulfotransferase [Synechococcus sp. PCC 7335]|uniref:sulfotransferase family protein n=1 Tax=Synechococcus sp. (strain ATCC 29403 / PCC 7335) TaxID=91464 RepID=UPI000572073A|nr:sulfotransferase [Synechococcus sp. PCC 7335]
MLESSSPSRPNSWAKPVTWKTLPYLAKRTAGMDRDKYRTKQRSLTINRVWSTLFPNLSRPVFLIGAACSGTTFLGDCLAEVPELSYHFEPIATKAAARCVYEGLWSHTKAKFFYRTVYAWLMRLHADGDLRFVEKTPRNCCIIPFLNEAFPDAQFIHIIRDGRDAALSLSKKPWLAKRAATSGKYEPGGYPYGPYAQFWVEPERRDEFETTSDIHRCIWAWHRFTEEAITATRNLPSEKLLEVRYESFGSDPVGEADKIMDFLGIKDENSRRSFEAAVSTFNASLTEQWKQQLNEQQLAEIYDESGELLRQLHYL